MTAKAQIEALAAEITKLSKEDRDSLWLKCYDFTKHERVTASRLKVKALCALALFFAYAHGMGWVLASSSMAALCMVVAIASLLVGSGLLIALLSTIDEK